MRTGGSRPRSMRARRASGVKSCAAGRANGTRRESASERGRKKCCRFMSKSLRNCVCWDGLPRGSGRRRVGCPPEETKRRKCRFNLFPACAPSAFGLPDGVGEEVPAAVCEGVALLVSFVVGQVEGRLFGHDD